MSFDGAVESGRTQQTVSRVRFAIGSVAPTVILIPQLQSVLAGRSLDDAVSVEAGDLVAEVIEPISDGRATADYRTDAVSVLVKRMLGAIAAGSGGGAPVSDSPLLGSAQAETIVPKTSEVENETTVAISVNGNEIVAPHASNRTLLDWLREETSFTGTKEGCAEGECGACTVLLDGDAAMACLVNAAQADGSQVMTVEGMGSSANRSALQQAFIDAFAAQCGFCIPGFIVAGERLLAECSEPSREQILTALSGNLCRCTGYYPMIAAVENVAEQRRCG